MKKRCISFIRNFLIAVFCTFTAFSHCLFGYASNDDEYLTFSDLDFITAYQYWYNYGLKADQSYTYTDTYTTNGTISESASISLSGSGSTNFTGASNNDVIGMIHSFSTDETVYNLVVNSNSNVGSVNYYGSTNSLHLACSYSNPQTVGGAADSEYATLTCTDPNFNDAIPYYVTLYGQDGTVRLESFTPDEYAIFKRATDGDYNYENDSDLHLEGLYSFSGSLSVSESGSLSGNGSISLNTTTTNVNNLTYVIPLMKVSENDLFIPSDNPNARYRYYIDKNDPIVIAFFGYSNVTFSTVTNIKFINSTDTASFTDIFNTINQSTTGGLRFYAFMTKNNLSDNYNNRYAYNVYTYNNLFRNGIIPIYFGNISKMSDPVYRFIFGSDRLIELLENGNNNSKQKEQELNTKTSQMQTQMTQFQNIEDTAGDNMNSALQNINTNPSLMSSNKFLVSVDWIRQQYNRLVTNTPFEAVITFCLVFGLGLLLLGKVR